jgi:hypothetical protein
LVLGVVGAIGGLALADRHTGGLGPYVHDRWTEFVSDSGAADSSGSRFAAVGLNGRLAQWKVAAAAFRENPVLGLGAQNYEIYYNEHRTAPFDVRQPHSQPLQLLAELGLPGLLLWLAFVILTLVRAGMLRFRSSDRAAQAVIVAVMTAVISWFIHSSADWLWQLVAVSLPALMLLGGLVGASDYTEPSRSDASEPATGAEASRSRRWARLIRPAAIVLAVLVIVSAALPYLSDRFSNSAGAATHSNPRTALARAKTAALLDPTSTAPYGVRAGVHEAAAESSPEGSPTRVKELALAANAWVGATQVEPQGWLYYYNAAKAFVAARDEAVAAGAPSAPELDANARRYLAEAHRLNPLSPQIAALEKQL